MKKKHVDILQHWPSLDGKLKKNYIRNDEEFISFLTDCLFNILSGVVPIDLKGLKRFEKEVKVLTNKTTKHKTKVDILSSGQGKKLIEFIAIPCIRILISKNVH